MKIKAAIHTFGCRLNSADSALMVDRLRRLGCDIVGMDDHPDLILVNSCAVTAEAVRKGRRMLHKLRTEHPEAKLIATGCAVEFEGGTMIGSDADLRIGNAGKSQLEKWVSELLAGKNSPHAAVIPPMPDPTQVFQENAEGEFPFRSRAFLKIQEGCDNFCTYCIVPYVRGRARSRSYEEVLADCKHALAAGFPELVLTGVNVCAYSDAGRNLEHLIAELDALPGNFRIRLSSTEPHPGNRTLIPAMANAQKVCRFLHLALQHGSDRILKRMNRHYVRSEYADFADHAREAIPDLHLGSDLIVGFPGETEQDFLDSCDFIRKMRFANLHIFSYSPRPGTPAAEMPDQVPSMETKRRYEYLAAIAAESARDFKLSQLGKSLPVIFEETCSGNRIKGWSDNYLQLKIPAAGVKLDKIINIVATRQNLELES